MKKIIGNDHTEIMLEDEEAKTICRLGQESRCCAFLVCGARGFECIRMSYPMNAHIFARLSENSMNARGKGQWEGCPWANEEQDPIDSHVAERTGRNIKNCLRG